MKAMASTIGPRLNLRQSPSLALTPELRQAIRILQLSAADLEHEVEEALSNNPFLERAEPTPAAAAAATTPTTGTVTATEDEVPEPAPLAATVTS